MPEGVIRVMCPNLRCRAVLAVPGEARGRLVRCRNCGMNIKIPLKAEPKAEASAEAGEAGATGQPPAATPPAAGKK